MTSRGIVLVLLVTLAAPILLYLIGRTAILGLSAPAAASLPPADPTPLLRRILPAVADPRTKVPDRVLAIASQSAVESPLAYEPFLVFGRKAADEGDLRRAIMLTEEARRRRPNFLLTRLLLMSYYGRTARYADALGEMDYLLRSSEGVRRAVVPELVKTLRTAAGRRALADVLAARPAWRPEFIAAVQAQGALNAADARQLLDMVRARRPEADWTLERGLYMDALVRGGDVAQARRLWLSGFPEAERSRHAQIFDGEFTGRAAPQPFGWRLFDTPAGRAEVASAGGRGSYLDVNYFGGVNVVLAEQMLALAPGSYQLSFNAKSDGGIRAGQLYWSFTCIPNGAELGRIPVANPQSAYRRLQGGVQIPASGCSGQRLQLVAEPGDVASEFAVQLAQLKVARR